MHFKSYPKMNKQSMTISYHNYYSLFAIKVEYLLIITMVLFLIGGSNNSSNAICIVLHF